MRERGGTVLIDNTSTSRHEQQSAVQGCCDSRGIPLPVLLWRNDAEHETVVELGVSVAPRVTVHEIAVAAGDKQLASVAAERCAEERRRLRERLHDASRAPFHDLCALVRIAAHHDHEVLPVGRLNHR